MEGEGCYSQVKFSGEERGEKGQKEGGREGSLDGKLVYQNPESRSPTLDSSCLWLDEATAESMFW